MPNKQRTYIAIDLKSFFASVECVERGLNPLTTNLVVADTSRTEKTICLAVTPSLKSYGIPGRARLFEVVQKVREVNNIRRKAIPGYTFKGKSSDANELQSHPDWELDYIAATPRMSYYIKYSTRIYDIYLKYVAPEDIFVYSIDEVFIDATNYLNTYRLTAHNLAMMMIKDVLKQTGITATAGIGTNLYLCKIAMDIVAKHIPADKDGVRIAELDEMSYRKQLWNHQPLTSFWRFGKGIASKLEQYGIYTMGQIARCSLEHEDFLYRLFGVNAELIIDHAWGWEPCTMEAVKQYRPENNSLSCGQVLQCPYNFAKARVVVQEMAENAALDLLDKKLVTDQLVLSVGYDVESFGKDGTMKKYKGETAYDYYGRFVPKPAHGSVNLGRQTSSAKIIREAVTHLFDQIVNPDFLIRRLNLTTNHVVDEGKVKKEGPVQLELFSDYEELKRQKSAELEILDKERKMQQALLNIKKRFGKNAILKGLNFAEGATAIERNKQIGGHKA
ncbi:MAG: DNA methylase [Paludibacteraceae bacterium]|nr:DNA methylase [Paludibacteraceae bacterium]